jgi:threonine/homoserine/homoserine lactone efflux protein
MDYTNLIAYVIFLFLWMASPGPCFALVARNSVKYGIKGGIFTSIGMIICDSIFIFFAVVGVAEFLSHYPKILNAGKMIGAAYIFYIGVDILLTTFRAKKMDLSENNDTEIKPKKLILNGFLTDASNPLLIIGMLAIVLQFIDLKGSASHISFYAVLIPITTTYVNFCVAAIFGNPVVRNIITPYIKWFERFAGIAIAGLAIMMIIE